MEIDGQPARYFEVLPNAASTEESRAQQSTLAAMVTSGDQLWFFKMTGDRDLVAAQRDQFKDFLSSVRFGSDGGANDGNR